jgi:hypothetical protein
MTSSRNIQILKLWFYLGCMKTQNFTDLYVHYVIRYVRKNQILKLWCWDLLKPKTCRNDMFRMV